MLRHLRVLIKTGQYTRGTRVTRAGQYTRGLIIGCAAWGPRIAWKWWWSDRLLLLGLIPLKPIS